MTKEQKKRTKKHYTPEFKEQAIELAKETGAQEACDKLGITSYQTLCNWIRYAKKVETNEEFRELEELKKELIEDMEMLVLLKIKEVHNKILIKEML